MTRTEIIPASDFRAMPWKNGRGVTREIAVQPAPDGGFDWRLSIADVPESGPFSKFPGMIRSIAVATGAGMTLTIGGAPPETLRPGDLPLNFSGDDDTTCTLLDGPVTDVNLIWNPVRVEAMLGMVMIERLDETSAGAVIEIDDPLAFLLPLDDGVRIEQLEGEESWKVPAGAALRIEGGGGFVVHAPTDARILAAMIGELSGDEIAGAVSMEEFDAVMGEEIDADLMKELEGMSEAELEALLDKAARRLAEEEKK